MSKAQGIENSVPETKKEGEFSRIKSIEYIKNFKNFKSFDKKISFKKMNLFFGFNGSGKTNFSEFLNKLSDSDANEEGSTEEQNKPKFKVLFSSDGKNSDYVTSFQDNDFKDLRKNIKVFNSLFIKNRIKIEEEESECLVFLGKKDQDTQELKALEKKQNDNTNDIRTGIELYNNKANKLCKKIDKNHAQFEGVNKIDSNFGKVNEKLAKHIKKEFFIDSHSHYGPKQELKNHIKEIDDAEGKSTAPAVDYKKVITERENNEDYQELGYFELKYFEDEKIKKLTELLEKKIKYIPIASLKKNLELKEWVEKAYEYHVKNAYKKCGFCENEITATRWQELEKHFSDELNEATGELKEIKKTLEDIQCYSFPSTAKDKIYSTVKDKYNDDFTKLVKNYDEYKEIIKELEGIVDKKIKTPDKESTLLDQRKLKDAEELCKEALCTLHKTIKNHNQYKDNKNDTLNNAIKNYLIDKIYSDYIDLKATKDELKKLQDKEESLKDAREEFISKRSNNDPKIINDYINEIIGHSAFLFDTNEKENKKHYLLKREGKPATEVSEGEKTIIALAYYLASLKEKEIDIKNLIIVIDDPVSSLDSCYMDSILRILKKYIVDKSELGQLFILTHNFYFFTKIRKMMANNIGIYEITRDEGTSKIIDANKYLKKYDNEYNFLIEHILRIRDKSESASDEKNDYYLSLTLFNSIRRVLDVFTSFQCPSIGYKKLSCKIKKIIPKKDTSDLDKVCVFVERLNEGSHGSENTAEGENITSHKAINDVCKQFEEVMQILDKGYWERVTENWERVK